MGEFRMPSLGADMEKGVLVAWNVKPGDRVKRGDIIAQVETEKGVFDVESFEDGAVERLITVPGTKVPVGEAMAVLRGEGESPGAVVTPAVAVPSVVPSVEAPRAAAAPVPAAPHVKASPLARKVAAELGVDLSRVQGTGPGGVIDRVDVERSAAEAKAAQAPPPRATADMQAGMRHAIAAAMSKSNREIPHYHLATRIEMSAALKWLEDQNRQRSIKDRLLPAVVTLRAVARALSEVPALNGFWTDDRHQPQQGIHIGFAISLRGGGLIAPAIHDVDRKSPDEIMTAMRDVITRARSGHLRASEMTDATITVTNLGDLGVETVFGVIYPPQVALVGFGRVTEQPWAENGLLGVRPVLHATLSADHRATDGHTGAQFLDALNKRLQHPDLP